MIAARKALTGNDFASAAAKKAADVNGDNSIDIADVTRLASIILGKD
jgi:hypothetical protein